MGDHIEAEMITVEHAAQRLGIGRSLAYQAARDGSIPTVRIGKRVLVPVRALERMLGVESAEQSSKVAR